MDDPIKIKMNNVLETVRRENVLLHASRLISVDLYTVCPSKAMYRQGELIANLEKQAFLIRNEAGFVSDVCELYKMRDVLNEYERALVEYYYRKYLLEKNMTQETAFRYSKIENKAFADWSEAKDKNDFNIFKGSLSDVIGLYREKISIREKTEEEEKRFKNDYDLLLDEFDRGMTTEKLDECFRLCKDRIIKLKDDILKSKKKIRTDFLSRKVSDEQQRQAALYIMKIMGLDPERSNLSTSKHGFTSRVEADDVRLTTDFVPDSFISSIYTVLHEGGHSLFELLTPQKDNDYFIYDNKTLGMHESVSRFYENILGRSEAFISFIYPKLKEFFPEALDDVSERELYEAVNAVSPSLIRMDADEVTYTLHILIRYELEKEIFIKGTDAGLLPRMWNDKYEEYLGMRPSNDCEGILQDVQWTSDFGYFPVYSLGNFYGTMYYNRMKSELDIEGLLKKGDFSKINEWMASNVFKKADILESSEWIKDITGTELSPLPYTEYLEDKYGKLYDLKEKAGVS